MTQYRLLERNVDTLKDTDEFWDEMKRQWSAVPDHLIGQPFVGTIPYRRAIPEPEVVEQEPTIDPGEGWRLVRDDEIVLPTDQRIYVNNKAAGWSELSHYSKLREVVDLGKYTYAQIKEHSAWSGLVFRRRVTKKIVLKEYVERYGTSTRIEWRSESDEGFRPGFVMPDASWPTGQEREIEVPV